MWIGSMGSTIQHSKNGVTKMSLYSGLRGTVRALFVIMKAGIVRNNLAAAMLNLLACSKMNHIRMVHEFIMTRYLEVSVRRELQGSSIGILKDAWEYLGTLPEEERPIAKRYDSYETKVLQRDEFILFIDATQAIGNILYRCFNNFNSYQKHLPGTVGTAIKRTVSEYLIR